MTGRVALAGYASIGSAREQTLAALASRACSDAAGTQFCYSSIQEMIRRGRDSVPQQPQQPPQQGAGASLRQRQQAHSARGASSGSSGAAGAAGPPRPALDPLRGGEEEEVVCEQPAEDPLQGGSAFARCHLASDPGRYPYQARGYDCTAGRGWWKRVHLFWGTTAACRGCTPFAMVSDKSSAL